MSGSAAVPSRSQIDAATESIQFHSTCPITLEPFSDGENVLRIKACGHVFKKKALQKWFEGRADCPMCRTNIRSNQDQVSTYIPPRASTRIPFLQRIKSGETKICGSSRVTLESYGRVHIAYAEVKEDDDRGLAHIGSIYSRTFDSSLCDVGHPYLVPTQGIREEIFINGLHIKVSGNGKRHAIKLFVEPA